MSDSPTLDRMIARLTEESVVFGRGSAYADLHAICSELDARRLRALAERNEAHAERDALRAEVATQKEDLRDMRDECHNARVAAAASETLRLEAVAAAGELRAKLHNADLINDRLRKSWNEDAGEARRQRDSAIAIIAEMRGALEKIQEPTELPAAQAYRRLRDIARDALAKTKEG